MVFTQRENKNMNLDQPAYVSKSHLFSSYNLVFKLLFLLSFVFKRHYFPPAEVNYCLEALNQAFYRFHLAVAAFKGMH